MPASIPPDERLVGTLRREPLLQIRLLQPAQLDAAVDVLDGVRE
jgi:hypothetical protein